MSGWRPLRRQLPRRRPSALAQGRGVAHRDGRLDDDPGGGVDLADGVDGRLHAGGVEEVLVAVVVGGRGDDRVVGAGVGLGGVGGRAEVETSLPRLRLGEEALDLGVLDRRLVAVELLDLLREDVQGADLVALREEHGEGEADVARAGNRDLRAVGCLRARLLVLAAQTLLHVHGPGDHLAGISRRPDRAAGGAFPTSGIRLAQ